MRLHASKLFRNLLGISFAATLLTGPMFAQAQAQGSTDSGFTPYVGLPGKDVIWLPAELTMVEKMLDLAKVTHTDTVVDLGSGDGRTVIGAARRGAQAIGVELNPDLIELSRRYAAREGVGERATFVQQDLFAFDLSKVSVITLFLLDTINEKLRPKLLALTPGTRVISNTFRMGDWPHDDISRDDSKASGCNFNCTAYLWIIPAKASGKWRTADGDLSLKQSYQILSGTLEQEGVNVSVAGRLRGDEIQLKAGQVEYVGRVTDRTIEGTSVRGGVSRPWRAELAQ